jgi:hypothetical protein
VGPRALSNGLNSAIFFCFFEAIRQVGGPMVFAGDASIARDKTRWGTKRAPFFRGGPALALFRLSQLRSCICSFS